MSAAVLVRDGEISIHAPVKGATRLHDRHHAECGHFNPRSREGSDRVKVVRQRHVTGISIHAPVKGATAQGGNPALPALNFNPRSREGSDVSGAAACIQCRVISIHAPAKGATCATWHASAGATNFNPRSREGSDLPSSISLAAIAISIHAPAKGATPRSRRACKHPLFQSTLPRRERQQKSPRLFPMILAK